MTSYRATTLVKSRPNGFYLALECVGEGPDVEDVCFYVVETGDEDGVEFDGDVRAANAYYYERQAELMKTPNWELQARYDEEHGTDNGYDPVIEAWRRERGE